MRVARSSSASEHRSIRSAPSDATDDHGDRYWFRGSYPRPRSISRRRNDRAVRRDATSSSAPYWSRSLRAPVNVTTSRRSDRYFRCVARRICRLEPMTPAGRARAHLARPRCRLPQQLAHDLALPRTDSQNFQHGAAGRGVAPRRARRDRFFGKSSELTAMTIRIGTSERDGTFYGQGHALKTVLERRPRSLRSRPWN